MKDSTKKELRILLIYAAIFLTLFWLPVRSERFVSGVLEALRLLRWYAREHVLLCLTPAFFIAGAIAVFVRSGSVMKHLGAGANKAVAYGVAAVSGSVLAVCSCTVLPLFAGIWRMGAGLGPATAFLYAGPAVNVLAIILTARILGPELGLARAVGAVVFSVVIGLLMHLIYRREEADRARIAAVQTPEETSRPLGQTAAMLGLMVAVLVLANWGAPGAWVYHPAEGDSLAVEIEQAPFDPAAEGAVYRLRLSQTQDAQPASIEVAAADFLAHREPSPGPWSWIWGHRWALTAAAAALLAMTLGLVGAASWRALVATAAAVALAAWLVPAGGHWMLLVFTIGLAGLSASLAAGGAEGRAWLSATWEFSRQILPLLLLGVLAAGFLLGRPGSPGLIPGHWVAMLVGDSPEPLLAAWGGGGALAVVVRAGWPLWTNLFASVLGAFMYFATLTEVPILQGLLGAGMGRGPALALLLAGPALSLPNMLVLRGILGTRKTAVYCSLVVVMATLSGLLFHLFN